jgi:hypothetical protein
MILLWGLASDGPLAAVLTRLRELGAAVALLDQRAVARTELRLAAGREVSGEILVDGLGLDLDEVTAAYVRPYDARRIPAVARAGPGRRLWQHAVELDDALLSWCELTPAMVVNRPTAMMSNDSKPFQARLIAMAGFATPQTLITTDASAAVAFWEEHGDVIYKSCSGVRSIVRQFNPADPDRLRNLRWCPTQFQRRVTGTDVRVHVVGDEVFACRIEAVGHDYRYDADTTVSPCVLDDDVADRCRALSRVLCLAVAGIDLRQTPDGDWYCFEVNPSPGFTYFQARSGHPIDLAIARLLRSGEGRTACRNEALGPG